MEYKHFSHPHSLTFQQLQPEPEVQCSGCKSPATGSSYVCWQCSFFLHEQCYRASRALNHHSHPSHPLTLVPYPTYPSDSFICNSCNQTGTGFSFSCSSCDFDLHVHCSYNSQTTPHESYPNYSVPSENQTFHSQFPFPPPTSTHESHPNVPPNLNLYPSMPNNNPHESSYPNFPNPNHSLPSETPTFNAQYPSYYIPQSTNHSLNPHMSPETATHMGPNMQHSLVPNQTPQSFNSPPFLHQPFQNMSNLHHPPPYEAVPSFNSRTRPETPSNATNSVNGAGSGENQQKLRGVKHFSHDHPLLFSEIKEEEEDGIMCSGCEKHISGSAYTCTVSNCNFNLHNSCFGLPREIKKHKSHPEHSLSLLSTPPYENHQFACEACLEDGSAFVYNCSTCNFDLHVECAFLPVTVEREDHKHPLALLYTNPFKKVKEDDPDMIFVCDVCRTTVDERCWVYYCKGCDFGTHLGCVTAEQLPEQSEATQMLELQRLQFKMEMNHKIAQLNANMRQNILSLV